MVDTAKLAAAVAIALVGFVAYYCFGDVSVALRSLGVLVAVGIGGLRRAPVRAGPNALAVHPGGAHELRKVVWPTRAGNDADDDRGARRSR